MRSTRTNSLLMLSHLKCVLLMRQIDPDDGGAVRFFSAPYTLVGSASTCNLLSLGKIWP